MGEFGKGVVDRRVLALGLGNSVHLVHHSMVLQGNLMLVSTSKRKILNVKQRFGVLSSLNPVCLGSLLSLKRLPLMHPCFSVN